MAKKRSTVRTTGWSSARWGLIVVSALTLGAGVAWGLRSTCVQHGGSGAWTRIEDHTPNYDTRDGCIYHLGKVCYDCTVSDDAHNPRWIHCAEDEFGTDGECKHYDDWNDIPPLPGGQRRRIVLGE